MVVQILNKPKPKYTIGEIRYRCLTDYSWSKSRSASLEYKIGVSSGNLLGSFMVSCSSVIWFPCWLSKYRKKNHGPPESCMLPEFFIFLFSCNALLHHNFSWTGILVNGGLHFFSSFIIRRATTSIVGTVLLLDKKLLG